MLSAFICTFPALTSCSRACMVSSVSGGWGNLFLASGTRFCGLDFGFPVVFFNAFLFPGVVGFVWTSDSSESSMGSPRPPPFPGDGECSSGFRAALGTVGVRICLAGGPNKTFVFPVAGWPPSLPFLWDVFLHFAAGELAESWFKEGSSGRKVRNY